MVVLQVKATMQEVVVATILKNPLRIKKQGIPSLYAINTNHLGRRANERLAPQNLYTQSHHVMVYRKSETSLCDKFDISYGLYP